MNKKILYLLIPITTIMVVIAAIYFFARGSLTVSCVPNSGVVTVDNKAYPTIGNKPVSLFMGSHKIQITSDFYEPYESTVNISLWKNKHIDVALIPNVEGKKILEISKKVTEATATFSIDKNSDKYLAAIKAYIDSSTFDDLSFQIEDSLASQTTSTPTDLPKVILPLKNKYITKINGDTIVTVETTKTSDPLSLDNIQYTFQKINNSWLITDLIYN